MTLAAKGLIRQVFVAGGGEAVVHLQTFFNPNSSILIFSYSESTRSNFINEEELQRKVNRAKVR